MSRADISFSPVRTSTCSVRTRLSAVRTFPSRVRTLASSVRTFIIGVRTFTRSVRTLPFAVRTLLASVRTSSSFVRTLCEIVRTMGGFCPQRGSGAGISGVYGRFYRAAKIRASGCAILLDSIVTRADGAGCMITIPRPMSNAERQRRFQASHPGYDRRRIARKRASANRGAALLLAEITAKLAAEAEATSQAVALATKSPLLLPAPVRDETMAAIESLALLSEISTAKVALTLD